MTGRDEKMAPRITETMRLFTALLLIAAISRGQTENVYLSSGRDVTLSPNYRGDFNEIIWLVNDIKLVELELNEKQQPIYYKTFPRLNAGAFLNNQTGELTIPQLTIRDSGKYKAEVKLRDLSYNYTDITLTVLDPVVTPIITNQTTDDWIHLSCESATPGVSYEWQDDKGNIVSDDKTYTIPKPTKTAVTLTCIASNAVSEGRASVTIEPPGLSGWDIAGIIGWIFVIIFIVVIIIEKIRWRHRYGLPGWDIAKIIGWIFVIILIVVIIVEKIRGRYRYGLSGWDIAEIIGWIFVIIFIVVIILKKIIERYRSGGLSCCDITMIIGWIFVIILIVVIIVEKIRGRYRYGLSGWYIANMIIGWIFVVILIIVIIVEKIRGRYRYDWKRHVSRCTHDPCCIKNEVNAGINGATPKTAEDEVNAGINGATPKTAEDLLRHSSQCTRTHCCIRDEVIAFINRAKPYNAKDLGIYFSQCNRNICCIKDKLKPENEGHGTPEQQETLLENMGKDNLKPVNEGNGTSEQQETLLENMGKGNKTGSPEKV